MENTRQDRQAPRVVLLCAAAFFCVCAGFTLLLARGLWPALLICGIAAFALGGMVLLLWRGRYTAAAVGLLLGLLCCGVHGLLFWQPAQRLAGESGECRVALTDYAVGHGGWGTAWGRLVSVNGTDTNVRVKVYLRDGSPEYAPGNLLRFEGTIRAASVELSDGLLQRGVYLTINQTGTLSCEEDGAVTLSMRIRRLAGAIREKISLLLTGDEAGLLSALLTGDENGCSSTFLAALTAAGLRHIIAVSGLHLAILAGFLIRVLGRRAGVWLALPSVFIYAAVAGFPASALRAAVMQGFVLAAFLLRRENDSPTALSVALLLLCAWNPFFALSASLLLSFSATAGILWLYPGLSVRLMKKQPTHPLLRRLYRYFSDTLAVSLAATICTLPVTLLWFGGVSLIAVPMNLLCLWAVSLSLLLGIGALCLTALLPAAAPAAGFLLQWPLRYLTAVIGAAGRLPFASARASLYLALGAATLLLMILLLRRDIRRVLPLTAAALCLCFVFSALENRWITSVEVSGEEGAVMLALHSGGEIAFVGCGASDYAASAFIREAMARRGAGESAFLLATDGTWRQIGGARGAAEASRTPALTVPAGVYPDIGDSASVLWYTENGSLSLGRLTVCLLPDGESPLCMVSGAGISLLSLCGAEPWDGLTALAETSVKVRLLVIDGKWAKAPAALSRVCVLTGAEMLIYSDDGWNAPPDHLCGLPVIPLSAAKTVILETMR